MEQQVHLQDGEAPFPFMIRINIHVLFIFYIFFMFFLYEPLSTLSLVPELAF